MMTPISTWTQLFSNLEVTNAFSYGNVFLKLLMNYVFTLESAFLQVCSA